jgi:hypothetical protein
MNKLILSIIGVVGLTTVSWGQYTLPSPSSFPNSLYLNAFSLDIEGQGVVNLSENPWEVVSTTDIPDGRRAIRYQQSHPAGGNREIYIYQDPNGNVTMAVNIPRPMNSPVSVNYSGASLAELTNASFWAPNFNTAPLLSFPPTNFVNGLSPSGFPMGGAYIPPTEPNGGASGGVTASAIELNKGLTFQNGQWTPTQQ